MLDADIEQKLLDLIAALDRFSQEARFPSGLNVFEAAGLVRQEFKHSNFLAFLLRPQEQHGLNDGFLRRILQKTTDNLSDERPLSPLSIALADFSDALVRREWRNIDLLIESKNNNLVFAIENKIDSTESKNQLKKYRELVQSEFPDERKLFCYLTPDGEAPSDEAWTILSYSDIIDALQGARTHHASNLSQEASIIVDHYLNLIRRNVVPDQELIDQCRKLYALHKGALDLVIRYGEINSFDTAASRFFKEHPEISNLSVRSGRAAAFLPIDLLEIIPQMDGINWWGQNRPFLFWFNRYGNKIGLVLEVGPFSGEKFNRETLARKLLGHFQRHLNQISPRYTRVESDYKNLTEEEAGDAEGLYSTMEEYYRKIATRHLPAIKGIFREFFGT